MPILPSGLFVPPRGLPSRQYKNPTRGTHNPDGKPYEICPQCSAKSSVRGLERGHAAWRCERCGFVDCDTCPGGLHEKN